MNSVSCILIKDVIKDATIHRIFWSDTAIRFAYLITPIISTGVVNDFGIQRVQEEDATFIIVITYISASKMLFSWSAGEVLRDTFWYPPAGPIRTALVVGLFLLTLQGVAQFIHDYLLIKDKPL